MANFENGYIKVFRKMLEWEWYDETNTVRVFLHCLLRASWKDNYWRGVLVKRGSFITSRRSMSRELGLTEREVRTALEHLETTNEVTRYVHPKFTVITVVKYDDYQSIDQVNDQQTTDKTTSKTTNKRPSSDQVTTTDEESNKGNKGKNTNIKPPHRGWIPADSHSARYVLDHPSSEGWRIEVVNGEEWGYRVKQ